MKFLHPSKINLTVNFLTRYLAEEYIFIRNLQKNMSKSLITK